MASEEETPADRLAAALEMWEDGVQIMREGLRRRMPKATDDEIEAALDAWLCDRPPDADGVPVPCQGFGDRGRDLAAALAEWRARARVIRSEP